MPLVVIYLIPGEIRDLVEERRIRGPAVETRTDAGGQEAECTLQDAREHAAQERRMGRGRRIYLHHHQSYQVGGGVWYDRVTVKGF